MTWVNFLPVLAFNECSEAFQSYEEAGFDR
jgi:hypothetical protein